MHEGCSGSLEGGRLVVDKIRMMGFNTREMPEIFTLECVNCGEDFEMTHLESKCPNCNMVYGVTPCSVAHSDRIKASEINY